MDLSTEITDREAISSVGIINYLGITALDPAREYLNI
jgi:hypothetical protein